MIFIVILLALATERFFDCSHLRRWDWFERYQQFLNPYVKSLPPYLLLASYIVPPALLVGIIEYILSGWFYGFLRFVFDFVVLLYCLGPQNLWAQLSGCLQAMQKGDKKLVEQRAKAAFPFLPLKDSETLHQNLVRTIFVEGNYRIFAVIFWFAILGPLGAVLYRLTAILSEKGSAKSILTPYSNSALEVLDWLPARLLGLLFGLAGHFVQTLNQWKKYVLQKPETNEILIAETGVASLDFSHTKHFPENGEPEKAAILLFDRTLIIMLVVSAAFVLITS